MPWLQQWNQVRAVTGRIDLAFLLLRVFSLFGGVSWLLLMELPSREESLLIKALLAFFLYSLLCYLVIFFRPLLLRKVYLASLFLDLTFLSLLVHADPSLSSSFFLGYYLLICLHTIYFGFRFGLLVATLSALLYLLSIGPVLPEIDWTDLVMRLGFLFFLAIPVGLLSEKLREEKEQVEHLNKTLENRVARRTAEIAANYEETIFSFVDLIEQRDTYTAGHTERVAQYSSLLARELNLPQAEKKRLYTAAMLHDIGKVATPDSVLLKPGKLTELDYELIKLHPRAGYEMLSNIEMYKNLAKIILHHHERPDGKGYPNGLAGEEIPLLSRIMAVADAFDAMTTNRIYKGRKQLSQALAELQELAGSQFDAKVVAAAARVLAEVDLPSRVNQLPFTELEKKRFSYFFNDRLTGLYNEDYLKIVLNNLSSNHFSCLYLLHLRNLPEYNKRVGWEKGNQLFTRFAAELQAAFPGCLVFRAYGNDFAVISQEHLPLNSNLLKAFAGISSTEIKIDVRHVDLTAEQHYTIEKLEKLEVTPADEL